MTPTTYSARFTLYCPNHSNSRLLIGVVDTGASFTVIPAHILDELGVPVSSKRRSYLPMVPSMTWPSAMR